MSDKEEQGKSEADISPEEKEERQLQEGIARNILKAAKTGDVKLLWDNINFSFADVNAQDENGMTALHWATVHGARPCIRMLVASGKCDYLIRDAKGRYASELAFEISGDMGVAHLLSKKEAKQAAHEGRDAWPKT